MKDFSNCPKCKTEIKGVSVAKCVDCNETFCQECAKRTWLYNPKCPNCEGQDVKILGKIAP